MTFARLLAVLAVVLAAAVAGVSNASATTTSECQAQLAQLRVDTVAAESSFKLGDFQRLLAQLAAASPPKLDPATAGALSAQAQGVIDCINAIETV